jgi:hypothetical protein
MVTPSLFDRALKPLQKQIEVAVAFPFPFGWCRPQQSASPVSSAALSTIAGSLLTRLGWIYAGHASAKDWRASLEIPHP